MNKHYIGYFLLLAAILALGDAGWLIIASDRERVTAGESTTTVDADATTVTPDTPAAPAALDWPIYGGNQEQSRGLSERDLLAAGLPPRPCENQPTLQWTFSRLGALSPPIVFGDTVAVGDKDGFLRLVNLRTGIERINIKLGNNPIAAPLLRTLHRFSLPTFTSRPSVNLRSTRRFVN
jgi:hypothetical protein